MKEDALIEATIMRDFKTSKDYIYTNFFNASTPQYEQGWYDLYVLYLSTLKENHKDYYEYIKGVEHVLYILELYSVLHLFMKIVPIVEVEDREPFELLIDALEDLREGKADKLCLFTQLATTRLEKIKSALDGYYESCIGKLGNAVSIYSSNKKKREEGRILEPAFKKIRHDGKPFSEAYPDFIRDILSNNRDYLGNVIKGLKKVDKKTKDSLLALIVNLNDAKDAKKMIDNKIGMILEIDHLKESFRKKYDRMCKRMDDLFYLALPNSKNLLYHSLIENVFWKSQGRWPIKEYLNECQRTEPQKSDAELILGIPVEVFFQIMLCCKNDSCRIQDINSFLKKTIPFTIKRAHLTRLIELEFLEMISLNQEDSLEKKYQIGKKGLEFLNSHSETE